MANSYHCFSFQSPPNIGLGKTMPIPSMYYVWYYLPTFTIKINQMKVNMPYMDGMGYIKTTKPHMPSNPGFKKLGSPSRSCVVVFSSFIIMPLPCIMQRWIPWRWPAMQVPNNPSVFTRPSFGLPGTQMIVVSFGHLFLAEKPQQQKEDIYRLRSQKKTFLIG